MLFWRGGKIFDKWNLFISSKGRRFGLLIFGALLGVGFAFGLFCLFQGFDTDKNGHCDCSIANWLIEINRSGYTFGNSLMFLALSLPTLFFLWLFRTHDTREQIAKTQEQINMSLYTEALNILRNRKNDIIQQQHGLLLLIKLRNTQVTSRQIISNTINGVIQQNKSILNKLDLSGLDLSELDFYGAYLEKVNFTGANLSFAILHCMSLRKSNFYQANLSGVKFWIRNGGQERTLKNLEHCIVSSDTMFYGNKELMALLSPKNRKIIEKAKKIREKKDEKEIKETGKITILLD